MSRYSHLYRNKFAMKKKVATLQHQSEVWNKTGKSEADPTFQWKRYNGQYIKPADMQTIHLWNALKVAWMKRLSKNIYWKQAIANLYLELCSRPSLNDEMKVTLKVIAIRITKR